MYTVIVQNCWFVLDFTTRLNLKPPVTISFGSLYVFMANNPNLDRKARTWRRGVTNSHLFLYNCLRVNPNQDHVSDKIRFPHWNFAYFGLSWNLVKIIWIARCPYREFITITWQGHCHHFVPWTSITVIPCISQGEKLIPYGLWSGPK